MLPLLVDVLPDATPLVVEGKTAEFLRELAGSTLSLHVAGKESSLRAYQPGGSLRTRDFRSRLLERLRPADDDDRAALRRLCAGERAAGYTNANLWILESAPGGIERIATAILSKSEATSLTLLRIAANLTPKLRTYLGIVALDTEGLRKRCSTSIAMRLLNSNQRRRNERRSCRRSCRFIAMAPPDPRSLGWSNR